MYFIINSLIFDDNKTRINYYFYFLIRSTYTSYYYIGRKHVPVLNDRDVNDQKLGNIYIEGLKGRV